jgi:hypothetical protein
MLVVKGSIDLTTPAPRNQTIPSVTVGQDPWKRDVEKLGRLCIGPHAFSWKFIRITTISGSRL